MSGIFSLMKRYERHLSALAMVAGFVADNLLFERVDLWQTQMVFGGYALTCFMAIPILHWFETRVARGKWAPRWRLILPLVIQFALGGFWSGFVIFYGRSAYLGTSWPFLLFLVLVLIGNEYFHKYHDRLVFTTILFFFALYSYAIFAVPIVVGTIGTLVFLESGALAIGVFILFTALLRVLAGERFHADIWHIRAGALVVLVFMNLFYFTNILPPLPLAAKVGGIYHTVSRVPGNYEATEEAGSWQPSLVASLIVPTIHLVQGETLSAYVSVFAPTALSTSITHRWWHYDPDARSWTLVAEVRYPITGGRDDGYRGYSTVTIASPGEWRVDIATADERRITSLPFTVVFVATDPPVQTVTLP